jgi:hypothetical protein
MFAQQQTRHSLLGNIKINTLRHQKIGSLPGIKQTRSDRGTVGGVFEMSATQFPTHYSPAENGDILEIENHHNNISSSVVVSDIHDSHHLPTVYQILDQLNQLKNSDWERFQSFPYDKKKTESELARRKKPIKWRPTLQLL